MEDFCGSVLWDTDIFWRDSNPDFTFCFKQTVLIWVPCFFLWIFSPLDIMWRLKSRYSDIPWSFLNVTKFIILLLLISLCLTNLIVLIDIEEIFPVQFVSAGIQIITFIYVGMLQYLHKIKGHHTSGILFNFWILLVFCATPQLFFEIRNIVNDGFPEEITFDQWSFIYYCTYYSLACVMLLLNCFSDKKPRNSTFPKYSNPSPELSVSFLNKLHFQWFTRIAWLGFLRPLNENDLYDIHPQDSCAELYPPFHKHFQESIEKNRRKNPQPSQDPTIVSNGSTLVALIKAYGGPFWFSAILRLFCDALLISTPLILGMLINYINEGGAEWKGWFLISIMFIVSFLQPYLNGQYFHNNLNTGYRIRAGLMAAVYRKALTISSSVKKNTTVGEIVNLMAVDANRFFDLMPNIHMLWSGFLIIGVVTYLLYLQIGFSVFAGFIVIFVTFPFSFWIATKLKVLQIEQMKFKDERIKSINEILGGMKVLKLYAWEPSFENLILKIRKTEMRIIKKIALYNAGTYFIWSLAPFIVAMVSFITYVLLGGTLTSESAFISLALFNILRFPMTFFPMLINFLMQSLVAVKRIDKFLNSKEIDSTNVSYLPCDKAMYIKNGTFSWDGTIKVLKNINMAIKKGSLSAVVGPVGSGKTSLISAYLGEMEKLTGNVNIDGRIAYVPQQAWIQNATLQDNILFGKPMNRRLYEKVLQACALTADLAMLPGGDQTEIGEKGINLSGGQKQRISLARAVYSGAEIYIFDDPLSAVDSHVGKHIFDNVMCENGMLKGKTRLLATHALSFLPRVNEIFVMTNGEISEHGTYKELLAQRGAFSEFLLQYIQEQGEEEELSEELIEHLEIDEQFKNNRRRSSTTSILDRRERRNSRRLSQKSIDEEQESVRKSLAKLIENEEAGTGSVNFKIYLSYFKHAGLWMSILAFGSNILFQAASVGSNAWLAFWSASTRTTEDSAWNNFYAGIYGGLGGIQAITLIIASITFAVGCLNVARVSHNNLLKNILRLPMWFFDTTPLGRILNRFSRDVDIVDNIIPIFMRNWIFMLFAVIAIFIVISISTPWFLTTVLPVIIIYYFIQKFYIETSRQIRRLESLTRSPILAHFGETVSGQSVIRAYAEQKRFIGDSESKVDFHQGIAFHGIVAHRWLQLRLEIIGAFVIFFAALFAILARHTIGGALAGLSVSYALQVSQLLFFLVRMAVEVETNIVAIERIEEYIEKPQEAPWKTVDVDPEWPNKGIVEFKDFQVRYREGLDLVLKGVSFKLRSQEKIGIVGRTGAGKSSLTLSLFRIIEAAGGKIVIDDINIAEIGLHSLRSRLTIIPQDPVLFSGSLRMNIDPFDSYSDDAIWKALEHSHLKAFVAGLADGLSYKITEGGENLSVGQRQLVCLARALLRKTKVLILDEATAAIDFETDELIQKTIRTQFNDCTILTIAHRLNTIMDSDRIIVLDQGMIAEFDTPQALLDDRNSIFYSMAKNAGLIDNENMTYIKEVDENDD
ncbi:hypothetical protein PVAND_005699 [Polypedilum vanderplanki]|uniref:ABC-type glutathione-S-conjugate transporter n=1 Tax=Polypedilum vanderplanki TaxID=319348 RepID=A0A9J6C1U0_POLVA|nr:hypothetical protein PVAND_005699 [Polypedilum vanderplanki]